MQWQCRVLPLVLAEVHFQVVANLAKLAEVSLVVVVSEEVNLEGVSLVAVVSEVVNLEAVALEAANSEVVALVAASLEAEDSVERWFWKWIKWIVITFTIKT